MSANSLGTCILFFLTKTSFLPIQQQQHSTYFVVLCSGVMNTCHVLTSVLNTRVVPSENVANISASATVLEGVSRSRNALLNGNTRDYDWESGYTCHQLGSGCIVVQLAQPYIISSMRYVYMYVWFPGLYSRDLVLILYQRVCTYMHFQ